MTIDIWDLETYLYDSGVYTNGLRNTGESAHMDSMWTVTNYDKLVPALLKIKDKYTPEQWIKMADDALSSGYISPNSALLGYEIYRTILGRNRLDELRKEKNE
jgi:hypothetical protein